MSLWPALPSVPINLTLAPQSPNPYLSLSTLSLSSMDDRPLYDDEEEDLEEDDDEENDIIDDIDEEEDDDEDDTTSSSNFAVTVAAAPISSNNLVTVALAADPSRRYSSAAPPLPPPPTAERGLFQRLWTDDDEIEILKGFLDHISRRGGAHDAAVFYEEIRGKLRIEFNKSQLVEKLRRLKKKHRTVMGKINSGKEYAFKSPHDQATFEISKKIWFEQPATRLVEDEELKPNLNIISFHHNGGVDLNLKGSATPRKRARPVKSEEIPQFSPPIPQVAATPVANSIPGVIEETVRSCLTPILKELVQNASGSSSRGFGGIGGFSPMGFSFGGPSPLGCLGGGDMGSMMDERWRKQQILELEVYSKRLALVQDQIKSTMDELRSKGN